MKKYSLNENYFTKINTPNKAYILGFLYADGNVWIRSKRQNCIQICLEKTDRYILTDILNEIKATHVILESNSKYPRITISSNKLCSDLIKLGCIPRKSLILEWPTTKQVPKKFISHFIRGYFDGDGSVWTQITGRHKNPQYIINFVGTLSTCKNVSKILNQKIGFNLTIPKLCGNIYRICYAGNGNIKKFYNYIYADAKIFLTRKKEKMAKVFDILPYS